MYILYICSWLTYVTKSARHKPITIVRLVGIVVSSNITSSFVFYKLEVVEVKVVTIIKFLIQ